MTRYHRTNTGNRYVRTLVGIPTYNGAARCEQLLRSIRRAADANTYSLVLLDDGSPRPGEVDKLQTLAREYDATLLVHDKNYGITASWNDLARYQEDTEFVVLLNDDVLVQHGWLDNLLYFLEHNECGAASPNLLFCDPGDVPGILEGQVVIPRHPVTRVQEPERLNQSPEEPPGVVMCALGSGFGFRRSVFNALGGFDEKMVQIYNESLPGSEYSLVKDGKGIRLRTLEEIWQDKGLYGGELQCLSAKIVPGLRQAFLTGHEKRVLLEGKPRSTEFYTRKKIENSFYIEGEWRQVTRVVRHERHNKLLHVRQKAGSIHVTENHSMVVGRDGEFEVTTPEAFVRETLPRIEYVPLPETRTVFDFGDFLRGWDQYRQNDDQFWYLGKDNRGRLNERRASKYLTRKIRLDSEQGESFCWLLGFHVAEGSTSISYSNYEQVQLSIVCNSDMELIARAEVLIEALLGVKPRRITSTKGRHKSVCSLVIGHKALALAFREMCGVGARNKFVPDFLYEAPSACRLAFLNGYAAGDGWTMLSKDGLDESIQMETVSRKLAAGLSILCASLEKRILVHYRPEFGSYALRTVNQIRPNRNTRTVELAQEQPRFVYDLEVEGTHVFSAGVGPIVVHNSDFGTAAAANLKLPSYCIPSPRIWHLWSVSFKENPELGTKARGDQRAYIQKWGGDFQGKNGTHPRFMHGTMAPRLVKWIGPDGVPHEKEITIQ